MATSRPCDRYQSSAGPVSRSTTSAGGGGIRRMIAFCTARTCSRPSSLSRPQNLKPGAAAATAGWSPRRNSMVNFVPDQPGSGVSRRLDPAHDELPPGRPHPRRDRYRSETLEPVRGEARPQRRQRLAVNHPGWHATCHGHTITAGRS